MRVLVTGGAGYLGTRAVEELTRTGAAVRVLDRLLFSADGLRAMPNVDLRVDDVRSCAPDVMQGIDVVVHLAAVATDGTAYRSPRLAIEVNFLATQRLVRLARAAGVRGFILASTCAVYAGCSCEEPAASQESDFVRPISPYAVSKRAAEEVLEAIPNSELSTTSLRFATLYGPSRRMRYDLMVNTLVKDAFTTGCLHVDAAGLAWRPTLEVGDAARAIAWSAQQIMSGLPPIVNVASDVVRVLDVAERVRDALARRGKTVALDVGPPRCTSSYRADASLAQSLGLTFSERIESAVDAMWSQLGSHNSSNDVFYNDAWFRRLAAQRHPAVLPL